MFMISLSGGLLHSAQCGHSWKCRLGPERLPQCLDVFLGNVLDVSLPGYQLYQVCFGPNDMRESYNTWVIAIVSSKRMNLYSGTAEEWTMLNSMGFSLHQKFKTTQSLCIFSMSEWKNQISPTIHIPSHIALGLHYICECAAWHPWDYFVFTASV